MCLFIINASKIKTSKIHTQILQDHLLLLTSWKAVYWATFGYSGPSLFPRLQRALGRQGHVSFLLLLPMQYHMCLWHQHVNVNVKEGGGRRWKTTSRKTLWGKKAVCAIAVPWPDTESTAYLINIPLPSLILLDLIEEVKPVKWLSQLCYSSLVGTEGEKHFQCSKFK